MYENVNFNQFNDWFEKQRPDNFSYEGRFALFNYLEELENDTGDKIEFDPIAFCCEYSEYENIEEYNKDYEPVESIDKIRELTTVIEIPKNKGFIIQQY